MFLKLVVVFTALPLLELYVLIKVGGYLGAALTVALVFGTGILGAYLARREGWRVWQRVLDDLDSGVAPTENLLDAALVLAAGLLLITPGLITDLAGLGLLLPPLRAVVGTYLRRRLERYVMRSAVEVRFQRWP
jgi:UPF0716 protein FxsA